MTDQYPEGVDYIRNIGPLPMFWGSEPNSMDAIEAAGYNDYYILAQEKIALPEVANKPQEYKYRPTLFIVTKTIMGRSIVVADEKNAEVYASTRQSAQYFMPKMPWAMVQKMDLFFRSVHKKYGTEAILVLTYDLDMLNSDDPTQGWNCISPKQTNTAGACDYEPDSILPHKKDSELIFGTIHSHPEMSAFFSGTDHKDQDDWDGVHITQAWKGNGPTEYHIAMILGGHDWVLRQEDVFDTPPLPELDTDIVETWMETVEKKVYQTHGTGTGWTPPNTHGSSPGTYRGVPTTSLAIPLPTQSFIPSEKVRAIKLPAGSPNPATTVIVPEYDSSILEATSGSVKCRLCDTPLLSSAISARRCIACSAFIILNDETVDELHHFRIANNFPYNIYIDPEKSPHPISILHLDDSFSDDQRTDVSPKV